MHAINRRFCFALTAVFGFAATAVRAEMITPDSIPNPPAAVGSVNGTPVYAGNLVSTQYAGLGLTFNYQFNAISRLNGVPVWVPVAPSGTITSSPPPNYIWGHVNYSTPWLGASLNSLTTRIPITVSSLTVETIGNPSFSSLHVYGRTGPYVPLHITPVVQSVPGTNDEKLWKFSGAGIWSFSASAAPPPGVGAPASVANAPWGVAAVYFTPTGQTPEPSSLVLAGLGAMGLAARFGWRRTRGASA